MPRIAARLSHELATAFEAVAARHGGRSALLRELIVIAIKRSAAMGPPPSGVAVTDPGRSAGSDACTPDKDGEGIGLRVRFRTGLFDAVEGERVRMSARQQGMSVPEWFRALALDNLRADKGGIQTVVPQETTKGQKLVRVAAWLRQRDADAVRRAASARGMLPGQWVRSQLLVRLGKGVQYTSSEQLALRGLAVQISRVGVNLNQLARRVNEARKLGKSLPADPVVVEEAKAAVERALDALEHLARGNIRYWELGE